MKFFILKGLCFLPILFIILGVNYLVDPANIFNSKYEKGIVNYLVQGYNVTNILNYDERLLQKYFIKKMHQCPNTIALGSSRVMLIDSKLVANSHFINNGMSSALLEDDLAIYSLYEKKGCKIDKVIFSLEPYLLNENPNYWNTLDQEYKDFSDKLINKPGNNSLISQVQVYSKYTQLFSTSYFKASLDYSLRNVRVSYMPTKKVKNNGFTKLADGSIYYDKNYRNNSVDKVNELARNTIAKEIYGLSHYPKISDESRILFTRFIEYLQEQKVEVEFLLSPYHPIVYEYFKNTKSYHMVFESEKYFRNYAKAHHIKIYGSYDPQKYNLSHADFYDGYHCKPMVLARLLGVESLARN